MKAIKRVNGFFLVLVVLHIGASLLVSMLDEEAVKLGTFASLMLTQLLILVPSFLFFLLTRYDIFEWIPFRRLNGKTIFLVIVFTFLIMPLISCVNIFSQLFTTNTAVEMLGELTDMPAIITVLIVGFVGPFCEEFTFRGVIYGGLRQSGYLFAAAAVTGIYFGLMHLNLNQFSYALVLGLVFSLLNEAAGSIWASIIGHAVVNTWNVILMLFAEKFYSGMGMDILSEVNGVVGTDEKLAVMGIVLVMAVVTTALAVGTFVAISESEGRLSVVKSIFKPKHDEETETHRQVITVSGYIAIALCLFVIFLLDRVLGY